MGMVRCFEELRIWQDARALVVDVYRMTAKTQDYSFNDQIRRAAVSIMNNIAEGYESGGKVMFKKYLLIAKGSCGEVRSMLYLAKDFSYIDDVGELLEHTKNLSMGISKLVDYLTQK